MKLAALEIPLQYDGFTQTLHGFPLKAFNIARARLGNPLLKAQVTYFYHTKRQSTGGFIQKLNTAS